MSKEKGTAICSNIRIRERQDIQPYIESLKQRRKELWIFTGIFFLFILSTTLFLISRSLKFFASNLIAYLSIFFFICFHRIYNIHFHKMSDGKEQKPLNLTQGWVIPSAESFSTCFILWRFIFIFYFMLGPCLSRYEWDKPIRKRYCAALLQLIHSWISASTFTIQPQVTILILGRRQKEPDESYEILEVFSGEPKCGMRLLRF